jgi:hypothetical protein
MKLFLAMLFGTALFWATTKAKLKPLENTAQEIQYLIQGRDACSCRQPSGFLSLFYFISLVEGYLSSEINFNRDGSL